ncbi:MAG: hypothetical protein EOO04_20505, partial [Chitinophagaceae bacterium]
MIMKRQMLLSLMMLSGVVMYAQKNKVVVKYLDKQLQFTSKGKAIFGAAGTPVDGGWYLHATYPDSSSLVKAYFSDKRFTVKQGPYTLYHPRNIPAMQGSFKNNIPVGRWQYWYQNGQLKDSGMLDNNYMVGTWKSWSEQGRLLILANYAEKANRAAPSANSRNNSLLPGMSPFPGVREGLSISYYSNGVMQDSGTYTGNKRTGPWRSWHANGRPDAEGVFVRDSMDGKWTFYRENGHKSAEEIYKNGIVQKMTCYDNDGNAQGNYCSVLKPPIPQGPFADFAEYMMDNVFWPPSL